MKSARHQRGFSLVEVLIATTIGTFAMTGVLTTFIALQRSYAATADSILETNRFIVVQDQLGLDLRNAVAVTAAEPARLVVQVNYYGDTEGTTQAVIYEFHRNTGVLERRAGEGRRNLMTGLTESVFVYYRRNADGGRAETNAAADVNAVQITVTPENFRMGGADRPRTVFASSLFQLRKVVFP